jgi:hypothetical protein
MKIMFTFGRTLQLYKSKMFYSHKMRNQKRYFATKVTHREVKQNVTTTWVIYIICQEFNYTYILYMILLHGAAVVVWWFWFTTT